jgi:hypothetical protein
MEYATYEASIPTENTSNNSPAVRVSGTLPPSHTPPPLQQEDLPVAKRPRLSTSNADEDTSDTQSVAEEDYADEQSIADADTDYAGLQIMVDAATSMAASLPKKGASRAAFRRWTPEEDELLTAAVGKHGKDFDAIAALIHGRSKGQCRGRWTCNCSPSAVAASVHSIKGKWTPEEDELLNEAVQHHGKKWIPVAALVPGRTNMQCRSRWMRPTDPRNGNKERWKQEGFSLLTLVAAAALIPAPTNEKCHDGVKGFGKGKWTPEEDTLLAEAYEVYGANWLPVAALVPGRSNLQCSARWLRQLDPNNGNKGPWTPEEDALLTETIGKIGKDWATVATMIPGRRNEQCRDRWVRCLDTASMQVFEKGAWTPEEDAKLTEAVQKFGTKHWAPVATLVCTRSNKQCRHRWMDYLDPILGPIVCERKKSKKRADAALRLLK